VPYDEFTILDVNGDQVQFDNYRPVKQVNANPDESRIANYVRMPVKFDGEEFKVFFVVRGKAKKGQNLAQLDTSYSTQSNFAQVSKSGDVLKYGGKTLRLLGLNTEFANFEFSDGSITQRFKLSPRYYRAAEGNGHGDGLYEFKPDENFTRSYSQLSHVEVNKGEYSGQFLLHFIGKTEG